MKGRSTRCTDIPDWRRHLDALVEERLSTLHDRAIGVFGTYVPPEVILALDLDFLFLTPGGTFQTMQAGEEFIRQDACPLCRSQVGAAIPTASWVRKLPLILGFNGCDQRGRMLETLETFQGLVIHASTVPRTRTENAFRRYLEDLEQLAGVLALRFGTRMEPGAIHGSVSKVRDVRNRLTALRGRFSFVDFVSLAYDCLFLGVDRAGTFLSGLVPEDRKPPEIRLFLAGSCLAREDRDFACDLTRFGADVVDDATALLGGYLDLCVPEDTATLEALAAAYFHQPDVAARPNDGYHDTLRRRVEAAAPDGILYRCLKFCDVNTGEQMRLRKAFEPLPVLFLDDEYDAAARPRRLTRLEAFMEMIRCRKA